MSTASQTQADPSALREEFRQIFGDKALKMIDHLAELSPERRAVTLEAAGYHGGAVRAIGAWPSLTVIVDGESFSVRPGADRILIQT